MVENSVEVKMMKKKQIKVQLTEVEKCSTESKAAQKEEHSVYHTRSSWEQGISFSLISVIIPQGVACCAPASCSDRRQFGSAGGAARAAEF